jgi:hypothetical protein
MNSREAGIVSIRILALVMWLQFIASIGIFRDLGVIGFIFLIVLSIYCCVLVLAAEPIASRFARSEESSSDVAKMSPGGWMVLIIAIVGLDMLITSCIQISTKMYPFLAQLSGSLYSDPYVTRMLGFDAMIPIMGVFAGLALIIYAKKLVWIWYNMTELRKDSERGVES